MRALKAVCCAAAFTLLFASGARADDWNKKTILTFSGPVQIPGATLPTGTYVFKLADIPGNRHVVQVFDKDEKKLYTTMLAIPNERMEPTDKPVILFAERSVGTPQAVKVWFYPGERIGNEFVYPKSQAMRIAKATHQRVLAYNNEPAASTTAGEVPESMKSAELGYFDENGKWQPEGGAVAVSGERAATTAPKAASTTASASNQVARSEPPATGTAGAKAPRRHLPRTGSDMLLLELMSALSLAGGCAARSLRARL
jgi:hypothetical protein